MLTQINLSFFNLSKLFFEHKQTPSTKKYFYVKKTG
jgi:hypothetical protein